MRIKIPNSLFFVPRQDEVLDQLVREVMQNDLALRAVVGEAEMLILPSVLLPNHHQSTCFLFECSLLLLIAFMANQTLDHSYKNPELIGLRNMICLLERVFFTRHSPQ